MSDNSWDVLTPREISQRTGIAERTVLDHLASGEMKGSKRGSRWYVRREFVEEFLAPTNQACDPPWPLTATA